MNTRTRLRGFALACFAAVPLFASAVDPSVLDGLAWRNIGPAIMGGRISDIVGVPGDPTTLYVAAGSGGVFRTVDGGITWTPVFDHQSTISIGAIAIDPGNPKVLWVGTGESNVRNSVSFGDGIYKTEDGGATWKHLGLEDTQTISRIAVDPNNPNKIFVAAVGHVFGPNAERGVFVTEDGGQTWRKSLFIDNEHGASDLEIDPHDSNIVYAGMWHFNRKPWTYTSGSEQGGVFQSMDGGRTWHKLTSGLPKLAGRIGVQVAPGNAKVVYVIAESRDGALFRSADRGATFTRISDDRELFGRGYYYCDMRVFPDAEDHIAVLSDALLESHDGGKQFQRMSPKLHGDLQALWIDPKNPRRIWQGHDGGLGISYDGGLHWQQVNNIPLAQFYRVSADNRQPFYNVTAGMQDNGTWTGPSRTREPAGIFNDDWRMINGFVGFESLSDLDDPDILLTEQSGGMLLRTNMKTREQQLVGPSPRLNAGAPANEAKYRFNWDAPLLRSPHHNRTIYLAGNVVFQSSDSGKNWETISHDLTTNDKSKLVNAGGPVWIDNSASEVYSTITSLAESPVKAGVLWAGTDDGNVQITTNGGGTWTNVARNLQLPPNPPVSHIEASRTSAGVAYVALDRHTFDDFRPYVFKTTDGGQTWINITGNLPPTAFVHIVREDPKNANLLYAGTELGLYASTTAGHEWFALHLENLPRTIAVRDIQVHPETNDLIIATHGRGIYILDDATPLQQLASATPTLFDIRTALRFTARATRIGVGDMPFAGPNPPYGALITYYLPADANKIRLEILSGDEVVREIICSSKRGVTRLNWDLRYNAPSRGRLAPGTKVPILRGAQALPGRYKARLVVDGKTYEKQFDVQLDPSLQVSSDDLQLQFETSREIANLQAAEIRASARLVAFGQRNPAEAERLAAKLSRPKNMGRSETGPGLREQFEALFNIVDSVNAAPAPAVMKYFAELQSEFRDTMTALDAMLRGPATAPH